MIGYVFLVVVLALPVIALVLSIVVLVGGKGQEAAKLVFLLLGVYVPCVLSICVASWVTLGAKTITALYSIPDVSWNATAILVVFFVGFALGWRRVGLAFCD